MKTLNEVTLIGHVGKDPELRETDSGAQFLPVSIATNLTLPPAEEGGEPRRYTEWHSIVFWGRLAELGAQMVKKGIPLFVRGRLRTYEKDGYRNTVITAQNFIVLKKRDDEPDVPPEALEQARRDVPF